jgi:hypothetical protein
MNKKIIIATLIFPERLEWYLDYLYKKFKITKESVFIYQNTDDESKLVITFRFKVDTNVKLDFKNLFPNAVQIHRKLTTFYSINALNKIIEKDSNKTKFELDYSKYQVDWAKYKDQLILTNNNELVFLNLKRIF